MGDWRPGSLRFAFLIEPPFCYRTPDGAVTGCDVELARQIADQIGADAFDPIETEFAELLPGLLDGCWHMTTGLFVTEERGRPWTSVDRSGRCPTGCSFGPTILTASPDTHPWRRPRACDWVSSRARFSI